MRLLPVLVVLAFGVAHTDVLIFIIRVSIFLVYTVPPFPPFIAEIQHDHVQLLWKGRVL